MKTLGKDFIDPRGFMNFDLGTLNNGQSIRLDFAMTYHKGDLSTDHFSRVDTMLSKISLIKDIANECFDSEEHNQKCIGDCVWPGDTDHNGIVNNMDILNIGPALKVQEQSGNYMQISGIHFILTSGPKTLCRI